MGRLGRKGSKREADTLSRGFPKTRICTFVDVQQTSGQNYQKIFKGTAQRDGSGQNQAHSIEKSASPPSSESPSMY